MMVVQVTLEGIINKLHVSTLHSRPPQGSECLTGHRAEDQWAAGLWRAPGSGKPLAVGAILSTLKGHPVIPVRGIPAEAATPECLGKVSHPWPPPGLFITTGT